MSRLTKWKLEKTKVKVVFRLQFNARHVPQSGWDKLFISFISADSGKTIAKTTKANVRNGTCKWADPIYETTRLLQDSKSKQYDEKLYSLVVAMGSSRASILGEATINLSDYGDALKPSTMALTLHGCNFGTILHVTVQLLTSKTGFKEFEQQRDQRERRLQLGIDNHEQIRIGKIHYSEEEDMNLNQEYTDSAAGFDGSSNTSESLYACKNDTSCMDDADSLKSKTSGDLRILSLCQSSHFEKGDPYVNQNMPEENRDSSLRCGSDNSFDNELSISCEEINRLRESIQLAESTFLNLQFEVSSLQSQASELGTETDKFTQLLTSEISSFAELASEVSFMKSECLKFKDDIITLKNLKCIPQITVTETRDGQIDHSVQDVLLQSLNAISLAECKIRELQSNAYGHDYDGSHVYSELEALLDILVGIKSGNCEAISCINAVSSGSIVVKDPQEICTDNCKQYVSGNEFGLDLCQPDSILQNFSVPPPVADPVGAVNVMKGQLFDIVRELDEAKIEKERFTRKMDQMECYYEALIQELEENQKRMVGELQHLRNEHSTSLVTLTARNAELESMRLDMNQQIIQFADERHEMDGLNKELERRMTASEAALKRARLNYSIAVEKLQKDLELLSSQVVSMFETNENLIKQDFVEPSQSCLQGDQKLLQNTDEYDGTKSPLYQSQCLAVGRKSVCRDILLEDLKRSFSMQEELYQKVEEELIDVYSVNMDLDIYSKTLKESLLEANASIRIMKGKIDEFVEEFELSAASQNQLIARLHKATDDIHTLNEYKSSCIFQCNELAVQNQLLEDKLNSLSHENHLFSEKLKDLEDIKIKCESYRSKFETCLIDNAEQSLLLKQEASENEKLQNELSLLKEMFSILKAESDELASLKENLEEHISFARDKLANLLESYKQFFVLDDAHCFNLGYPDIKDVILQLEEIQHNACENFSQLIEQNKNLEGERNAAHVSLNIARSEILAMKQKFKSDLQDMMKKTDVSNAHVDKLQAALESVANKFQFSSEIADNHAKQNKVILADLGLLEDQMQELASKIGHFAQDISCLGAVAEELGSSKSTISALTQENQLLVLSLLDETGQSIELSSENTCLKGILKNLCVELQMEKSYRDELQGKIRDLTFQLNKEHDNLIYFNQIKAELMHVRDLALSLELENSMLVHIFGQQKECMEEHHQNSNQASSECQLLEMYGFSVAADVTLIYVSNQYKILCETHLQQLMLSERSLREVQEKYDELEIIFNQCLTCDAHLSEEKSNLSTSLKILKSELEVSGCEGRLLSNHDTQNQFGKCESKLTAKETSASFNQEVQVSEKMLRNIIVKAENELNCLTVLNEELEIVIVVLKNKLNEQCSDITLLEDYKDSAILLRSRCDEISHKLNEQVMKTEEFKNLSIHFKELKDKAETEGLLAREKRETEGPPVAANDSLRIAFMKEQHATQLIELKQQISISKKHGEEMLLKLQDAIDEVETRKKSEAVHLKKKEELSQKIIAMDTELQLLLAEKREINKAYDRVKAELECALLSLECCKEEYDKLGASLEECEAEKSQLVTELNLVEVQLDNCTKLNKPDDGASIDVEYLANKSAEFSSSISLDSLTSTCDSHRMHAISILAGKDADLNEAVKPHHIQDECMCPIPEAVVVEELPHSTGKNLDATNESLGSYLLKSSMEHLHEELEKMKNENTDFHIDHDVDSDNQVPQREIIQLHKANEELRGIFPLSNEISSSGNALERVLALEIELAEALKAKNKLNFQSQSSFLKQHDDSDAAFQSFRDINELIREMLELKGRHATLEAELREMHDRYSQLSLQFAEVEGERQKLKMTLKNVRASKKFVPLNHSTSAT